MKVTFDPIRKRPACALISAIMGGDHAAVMRFPPETWLVHPTPDMATYEAMPDQMDRLIEIAIAATHREKDIHGD